jgi:hypothetical protein
MDMIASGACAPAQSSRTAPSWLKLHARQSYVPGTLTALLQPTIEALASGSKQHVKNFFKKI